MQNPASSSSTPSGTDESLCEFLVMLEETSPHVGKFLKLLKKQLPNSFYVKLFFLAGAGVVLKRSHPDPDSNGEFCGPVSSSGSA